MLLGDFFTILSVQKEGASSKVMLELNTTHPIFEGHFPGKPVVPGACLLQMVKEVTQKIMGSNIQLLKAHQLKFISLIDPLNHNILQLAITHSIFENAEMTVTATLFNNDVRCFAFSGIFQLST